MTRPASCGHDNLSRALNEGTTLVPRFFLSLATLFQAAGYLTHSPSWLGAKVYVGLNAVVPLHYWGAVYALAGVLGLWRCLAPTARPGLAWITNILVMLVWSTGLVTRLMIGPKTVLSVYTAVTLMALWCLLRTEATLRDTRSA